MKIEKRIGLPDAPMIKKVGIYCRVSSSKYNQMYSLANQVSKLIEDIANDPKQNLYDVYVDVCSGRKKYERKNMERLKADCKAGKVDYVITKSVSRFYRDTEYLLRTIRELREINVEIFFQNENISSFDKDSELLLALTGAVAQAESDDKSVNIKWGISKAKEDPNSKMNNRKFYGYMHDQEGKLIIHNEQAEVVKLIYKLYIEGYSILRIIKYLDEKQIPSPRGNAKWSKHSIEVVLGDERYTGARRIKTGMMTKPELFMIIRPAVAYAA